MKKIIKIALGFVGFIFLLFVAALVVPFIIDFNRFKPQIQEAIAKQVNAKIDFSSVRLTILSGLGFKLEDVIIENTDNHFSTTKFLQVKNVEFKAKVMPLLSGKFIGSLYIESPIIHLLKDGEQNNIVALLKEKKPLTENNNQHDPTETTKQPELENQNLSKSEPIINENKANTENQNIDKKEDVKIDQKTENDFVKNILVESFVIHDADISYLDVGAKKNPILIKKLNLEISNIGIDKDVEIIFSTRLDVRDSEIEVEGPISLKLLANVSLENSQFKSSKFKGQLNLDDISLNFKDAFVKDNSIPFHLSFNGIASPSSLSLSNFSLTLQSLESSAIVKIDDFKNLKSDISLKLLSKDVSSLAKILPQHKNLLSSGNFVFSTSVKGNLSNTNSIISATKLKANLYKSDIDLSFDENSISPINAKLIVKSQRLNLGEILKPFMSAQKDEKISKQDKVKSAEKIETAAVVKNSGIENKEPSEVADGQNERSQVAEKNTVGKTPPAVDSSPSKENLVNGKEFVLSEKQKQLLANLNFSLSLNIDQFIYDNVQLNNFIIDTSIENYLAKVQRLNFNAFNGAMVSNFNANLGVFPLQYSGNMSFKRIQIEELIKLIQLKQESPIEGIADLNFNFNGKGSTREIISKSLNTKGYFAFSSGRLNVKSLVGIAAEQLQKFTASLNIPGLDTGFKKIQGIDLGQNKQKDLQNLKGDFEIINGRLLIKNDFNSDQGNMKLDASIGLDETLGGTAVYTSSKSIKDQLIAQNKNFSYIFDAKGNLVLNLVLSGTVSSPSVNINPKNLEENLIRNTTQALRDKVKDQIQQQIKSNPQLQQLQDGAKKLLKDKGLDLGKFGF